MARIAWFTPLPPARSGIARYSWELLGPLSASHQIDVFVERNTSRVELPAGQIAAFDAHDFVWKRRTDGYDCVVYQLGNAPYHDYMWAYLARYPGLVVLHDGQLHHARGRLLLQQKRRDDYRREFWFDHPEAHPDVAELGAAGLLGSLTYFWPMLRVVVEASRGVLVHNTWLAGQILEQHPSVAIHTVDMGVGESRPGADARAVIRSRYGISDDTVVFIAFGKVTPEKRLRQALHALASLPAAPPRWHLLLAGDASETCDLRLDAAALGLDANVTWAGYVEDAEIDDYLAAADVCLCMRWPTSRETSASWLRCLAAGKPTISTDLVHTVDIPTLDPRDWSVLRETGDDEPVGVSIDIVDEDHSLGIAVARLVTDAGLRRRLGAGARALWHRRFRLERMVEGYLRAIAATIVAARPVPLNAFLPSHVHPVGVEYIERTLQEAGLRFPVRNFIAGAAE